MFSKYSCKILAFSLLRTAKEFAKEPNGLPVLAVQFAYFDVCPLGVLIDEVQVEVDPVDGDAAYRHRPERVANNWPRS